MKRKLVQCASPVNKDAVSRINIAGIEHIVVSSFTLPDNVVMNGGLYPAEEIEKSFMTLEETLAPVEHPQDIQGNYISASSPHAIHNFHAGAFNVNVTRENGRIHIQKHINVQEAMKTDRGKRLLDRINEIETNDNPRPVHTSVGVFLSVEELKSPQTNAAGDEFTWIARDMFFDHDAILLDSTAAALPSQGVGMGINKDGLTVDVERIVIVNEEDDRNGVSPEAEKSLAKLMENGDIEVNAEGASFAQLMEQLQHSINGIVNADWIWLVDVFAEEVIFETSQGFFSVQWKMSQDKAEITGIPIRVDREISYQPKVNSQGGTDAMKKIIVNALTEAGIDTEGLSDEELVLKYDELKANESSSVNDGDNVAAVALAVSEAIKPLTDQVEALTIQVNAGADEERTKLAEIVGNSDKYPGLDKETAVTLPVEKLKEMAANCGSAHGVSLDFTGNDQDETYQAPKEMPGDAE